MKEARIRNAIIVELLMPKPAGEDITTLRSELNKKLGKDDQVSFREFSDLLNQMTSEGLLKKEDRVVVGSRLTVFCQATRKAIAFLHTALTRPDHDGGLSIGRESHGVQEGINAVHG